MALTKVLKVTRSATRAVAQNHGATCSRHHSTARIPPPKATRPHVLLVTASGIAAVVGIYGLTRHPTLLDSSAKEVTRDGKAVEQESIEPSQTYLSVQEVAKHNLSQDAWVIVNGKIYDVTNFHEHHPGGAAIIVSNAGTDVSAIFNPLHPPGTIENNLPPESYKGMVDPGSSAKTAAALNKEKERIQAARDSLPPVETILGLDEFEEVAETVMSKKGAEYYHTGSLDGLSTLANKDSFRKCRIVPRVLRDVSTIEPQATIFGVQSALPIYVSPASNALLGHPDGELNITRGAAKTGIVQGVSYVSSYPLGDILAQKDAVESEINETMGLVYQIYVRQDRQKTESLIRQAIDGGCQALLLTVDSNVGDLRQSVEKMQGTTGSAEPGRHMAPISRFKTDPRDPTLNWKDLEWLKGIAGDVPIYLKGVSDIEDVRIAKAHGVRGCILSNHGGRQLDRARSGFDSLRDIHSQDPELSKNIELYVDGGVRRGSDVLMALAYGARGVGLGRSFLYAQAAYGEKGIIRAVRILENEILTAMQLMGVAKLDQLKPEMVQCLKELWH